MPTPPYPEPVAPTLASPLYEAPEGARCGDTFAETVEVRYPYGSTDEFVQELPRIWHMVPDISRTFTVLEDRIAAAIEDTTVVLDAYVESGEVDQESYETIDEILETAVEYLDYCIALNEEWAERSLVFRGNVGVDEEEARRWLTLSLMAELPDTVTLCEGKEPETVVKFDLPLGGYVEYECPGLGLTTIYAEAWARYKDTLTKAARQARCAQEALYSLVAYQVNRRLAEGVEPRPPTPGGRLEAPPSRPHVAVPVPLPEPEPPAAPAPPPPEPGWSTGKKVAVAALAAGGIAGAYWLVSRLGGQRPTAARATNWTYPESE